MKPILEVVFYKTCTLHTLNKLLLKKVKHRATKKPSFNDNFNIL